MSSCDSTSAASTLHTASSGSRPPSATSRDRYANHMHHSNPFEGTPPSSPVTSQRSVAGGSRSPSASSRDRYAHHMHQSDIFFESVATSSARGQLLKGQSRQRIPQRMVSAPNVFAEPNHSSSPRLPVSHHSSRETSPQCEFGQVHQESMTEAPGVLATFLLGRAQHAFGADALPRNSYGTTAISRRRAPPGGVSVLGLSHFHSPIFDDRKHRHRRTAADDESNLSESSVRSACSSPRQQRSPSQNSRRSASVEPSSEMLHSAPPSPSASFRNSSQKLASARSRYCQSMFCSSMIFPAAPSEQEPQTAPREQPSPSPYALSGDGTLTTTRNEAVRTQDIAMFKDMKLKVASGCRDPLDPAANADRVPERRRDVDCPVRAAEGTSLAQRKAERGKFAHPVEMPQKQQQRNHRAQCTMRDVSALSKRMYGYMSSASTASTHASDNSSSCLANPPQAKDGSGQSVAAKVQTSLKNSTTRSEIASRTDRRWRS